MSREERRHLARLLASIDEPHVLRDHRSLWRRRLSLLLFMGSCVVLAAWIAVLMLTLPKHYTAGHWRGAFAATAWAAWRERQALIILLTITGTLLCCDAWFDVILDLGTRNIWMSVASAVFAELPLAFIAFTTARRLVRQSVGVVMQLEGITADIPPLWKIPLFAEGLTAALPARYRNESRDPKPQEPAPAELSPAWASPLAAGAVQVVSGCTRQNGCPAGSA